MQLIFYPTFTAPITQKSKAFIAHLTHFRVSIVIFIRMSTHEFNIIIRDILIAFTWATWTKTEC